LYKTGQNRTVTAPFATTTSHAASADLNFPTKASPSRDKSIGSIEMR